MRLKKSKLQDGMDSFFDIFCEDPKRRLELEKEEQLRMAPEDYLFYEDQKGERKRKCLPIVEKLTETDLRFKRRVVQQHTISSKQKDQAGPSHEHHDAVEEIDSSEPTSSSRLPIP